MPRNANSFLKTLNKNYELLKDRASNDAMSADVAKLIKTIASVSTDFLSSQCVQVPLVSRVPEKAYFSFTLRRNSTKISRAVNRDLFLPDNESLLRYFVDGNLINLSAVDRSRLLYTIAIAYCCAADLLKTRDQKTPATFFECLIGHLFARTLGVNPQTQIEVLHLKDEAGTLPTDFIFDLGKGKPKFHVPVKTSTRERVIQVFAHQRVLDGVHGFGTYLGILVCLTETKLDHETREVIEICVPKQWSLYQRFIAPLHRVYYFDVPKKYEELRTADTQILVEPFGKFFDEASNLSRSR